MKKTSSKKVNVRKQLKVKLENTLIRHKNTVGFKPTEQPAYHWFNVINRGLFNGRLPRVPMYIKKYFCIYKRLRGCLCACLLVCH